MLVIVMGVCGSGKSTVAAALAKELNWSFMDADDFHPASNIDKMKSQTPLTDDDREPWLLALYNEIQNHKALQKHVVVACSALKRTYRNIMYHGRKVTIEKDHGSSYSKDTLLVYLKGDEETIHLRMVTRTHFMPPGLIESQFRDLEEPSAEETHIVVDIRKSASEIEKEIIDHITRIPQSRY